MEYVEIDGVGMVLLERSKRAKRLIISVRPNKGVRVAVPQGGSFKEAKKFALSKTDWIRKHLDRVKKVERELESRNPISIDKLTACRKLSGRLDELAIKHGFIYNKVSIRNQRTRWGSCSAKNNISLNMKLIRLPDGLIDYVILHELVHTRVKNHSKAFWDELAKYVVAPKKKSSELRKHELT